MLVCDNGVVRQHAVSGVAPIMSETVSLEPKPPMTRSGSDDGRALAQVEKWMAMIREISREEANRSSVPSS
jgi:hypothetical protein